MQKEAGVRSSDPDAVISADPDLAELGHAMARQFELSATMFGQAFGGKNPMAGMIDVLRSGAPLQFGGMSLGSVDHKPIAPDRFALPATPETPDQVRARLETSGGISPERRLLQRPLRRVAVAPVELHQLNDQIGAVR